MGVKWTGLKTRAEERREGKEVSNRKTRKGVARKEEPQGGGGVVHVTRYVEVGEDCSALVREYLGLDEAFCIIGSSSFFKYLQSIILIFQAFTPAVT